MGERALIRIVTNCKNLEVLKVKRYRVFGRKDWRAKVGMIVAGSGRVVKEM